MKEVMNVPNMFMDEDYGVVFVNAFELEEDELLQIEQCEYLCKKIEDRYKTKDIYEMIKQNAPRKLIYKYIDVKHDLFMYLGTYDWESQ